VKYFTSNLDISYRSRHALHGGAAVKLKQPKPIQTLKTEISQLIHNIYIKHAVAAFQHGISNDTKDQLQRGEAFLKDAREAAAAMVQKELPNRSGTENDGLVDYLQGVMEVRFDGADRIERIGEGLNIGGDMINLLPRAIAPDTLWTTAPDGTRGKRHLFTG
jgi:hypothetical protein